VPFLELAGDALVRGSRRGRGPSGPEAPYL